MKIEKRILSTTSILLLLTVAVIFFVAVPAIRGINDLALNITQQQSNIEQQYVLRNYAKRILADTETATGGLRRLRQGYIIENEELDFVQAMERAAGVAGVEQEISLETVNQVELNRWERKIPVKITVKGPFPQVMGWLNEVEHLDYYVIIESAAINAKKQAQPTSGEVDAYLTGHVFWVSRSAPYLEKLDLERS